MPQLDTSFFISQFFWLSICFGIFYLCIRFFVIPKASSIITSRLHIIHDDETHAKIANLQITELKASIHIKIQEVDGLIENMKNEANIKFEKHSKAKLEDFKKKIDTETRAAIDSISKAHHEALSKHEIGSLVEISSKQIISKIVGTNHA